MTEDDYIALERRSDVKHAFQRGIVWAMVGASPRHNAIAANTIGALGVALRGGPCVGLGSAQRVHVEATGLYTYPDVTVVCDEPRFHPKYPDTLLNPRLLVEVLSPSTEAYDRTTKFDNYRTIRSFEEYVLVYQDEKRVLHYRRIETGQWILTEAVGEEASVALPGLGCSLRLADLYAGVERFAPEVAAAPGSGPVGSRGSSSSAP
ncbi:Uma2 family endonuclease [Polyangium aurulentum]|uniref:Uma2 family endonuclease n=1 Tax=Polyangium aurulentum TaxID=2567896 RepID=UPI00146ECA50|nr:Uma2 family endonuclease [Polyangium aurulentum]UQA58325.1 Uma2 family endonuclease [Polyangium aurulentum]